jgi:predicted house-cleaning noncanonical NTP pyrophosphatase (MazG superfamily)
MNIGDSLATKNDISELANTVLDENKHEFWTNLAYMALGFLMGVILIVASFGNESKKTSEKLRSCEMKVSSCEFAAHMEIDALEDQLNDPEHCLSICVEEFKKYGC